MNTLLFNSRPVNQSSRRDYLRGASAILNLRGSTSREYDFSSTPEEADAKALGNDWAVVGATLEDVIVGYRGTDE